MKKIGIIIFCIVCFFSTSHSQITVINKSINNTVFYGIANYIKLNGLENNNQATVSYNSKILTLSIDSCFELYPEKMGRLPLIINYYNTKKTDTIFVDCINLPIPDIRILCGSLRDGTMCKLGQHIDLVYPVVDFYTQNFFIIESYDIIVLRNKNCIYSESKIRTNDLSNVESIVKKGDIVVINNLNYTTVSGLKGVVSSCFTITK